MTTAPATDRNTVIDGWRGISVLMVIAGHMFNFRLKGAMPFNGLDAFGLPFGSKIQTILASLGTLGVCFFFMISGYLITSLLIAESRDSGRISLKAFYVRRIFRIMPAFYAYVFAVYLLGRAGLILVNDEAVIRSSLYLCNFSGFACSWWLAHSWSLAVEEQFYLLWPMIFAFAPLLHRKIAAVLLLGLFLGSLWFEALGSFVYIMTGVIFAIEGRLRDSARGLAPRTIWFAFAFLIALPAIPAAVMPLVKPAQPFLVAIVLFGTIFGSPHDLCQRFLGISTLSKIGLISYSLYLWQQLSLAPLSWAGAPTGASNLYRHWDVVLGFAFIPLAVVSYLLIERPLIAAGHRLSKRIKANAATDVARAERRQG